MTAAVRVEKPGQSLSLSEIVEALKTEESRPDAMLRAAMDHAEALAPLVIDLMEKAATGVELSWEEAQFIFRSVHVLAAARRTELFLPLIRLINECPSDVVACLLGDYEVPTLAPIVISVFHGDAAPLIDVCADRNIHGFVRWSLMNALARLAFDGAIARETVADFLDRFDRKRLAETDDVAWEGWVSSILLLGLEEMREQMRAAWRDGRLLQDEDNLKDYENQLTIAGNLAAGDDSMFVNEYLVPIDDPVEALELIVNDENDFDEDPFGDGESENDVFDRDPAKAIALDEEEILWLDECLASDLTIAGKSLSVERIDGFWCALAMDSNRARAREKVNRTIKSVRASVIHNNNEMVAKAHQLLTRMWNTIADRLGASYAHSPLLEQLNEPAGRHWAVGFLEGMDAMDANWARADDDDEMSMFLRPILRLALDDGEELQEFRMTPERRAEDITVLRPSILGLHSTLRLRNLRAPQQPTKSIKVGRNEPCPCGSGKKFKRCCGSGETPPLH